jgi:hypothetical protein
MVGLVWTCRDMHEGEGSTYTPESCTLEQCLSISENYGRCLNCGHHDKPRRRQDVDPYLPDDYYSINASPVNTLS